MLNTNKNYDDLGKLNELASLQSQVKALRLQDILGKENFPEDLKKICKPVSKTTKYVTKTMKETSKENNKALAKPNDKRLDIMSDVSILASYSLFPLSKINNPAHTSQFKPVKDPGLNRVDDLLINKAIPATVCDNLLTFGNTDEKFELEGDLLKKISKKKLQC